MVSSKLRRVVMSFAVVTGVVAMPQVAGAQEAVPEPAVPDDLDPSLLAFPGPHQLVSSLDLECYDTPGPALNLTVTLSHLNPVLLALGLPAHNVILRELQQTCVPVAKNGVPPTPAALPFVRHVDLACYRVDAAALPSPVTLALRHLNPVLANLPGHNVVMVQPAQLCVPVAKNNVMPPAEVLALIRFIDLECYHVDPIGHPPFTVKLSQLNPQLANIPAHNMSLVPAQRQLCVPVRKNGQAIPGDVLNIVRWIDLEKFLASPIVSIASVAVTLRHLNPLFAALPQVPVTLDRAPALMVPVAKNGSPPPLP